MMTSTKERNYLYAQVVKQTIGLRKPCVSSVAALTSCLFAFSQFPLLYVKTN